MWENPKSSVKISKAKTNKNWIKSSFFSSENSDYSSDECYYQMLSLNKSNLGPHSIWFKNSFKSRSLILSWLNEVCLKIGYSGDVLSLTMHLLDSLKTEENEQTWQIVPLIVLSMVVKLLYVFRRELSLSKISEFFDYNLTEGDIMDLEIQIFTDLNGTILKKTTSDFLNFYLSKGVFEKKEIERLPGQEDIEKKVQQNETNILSMIYFTLHFPRLNTFNKDIIASSLICVQRKLLGLPVWPQRLVEMTKLSIREIKPCILMLEQLRIHDYINNMIHLPNAFVSRYSSKEIPSDYEFVTDFSESDVSFTEITQEMTNSSSSNSDKDINVDKKSLVSLELSQNSENVDNFNEFSQDLNSQELDQSNQKVIPTPKLNNSQEFNCLILEPPKIQETLDFDFIQTKRLMSDDNITRHDHK